MAEPVWFGTDRYFLQLKQGIADGNAELYNDLLARARDYALPIAMRQVGPNDAEDVTQEFLCRLLKSIAIFLSNSDDRTPYQRQAWLKTLLERTIWDYQDQNTFGEGYRTRKAHEKDGVQGQAASLSSLESWQEQGGDLPTPMDLEEAFTLQDGNATLNSIITHGCSLQQGPAEILTFFYHSVVFYMEGDSRKKGLPHRTAMRLKGKTLGQLRDALPGALTDATGYPVDEGLFLPLDKKLEGKRDLVYTFDSNKISVSSSYSRRRVAAMHQGKD